MLQSLELHHFRNHLHFSARFEKSSVVITGENGTGKTNILEALSFLVPGRGLRKASMPDIVCKDSPALGWGIHALLDEKKIKTGIHAGEKSRTVWCDDVKIPSTHLTHFLQMMWLTPWHDKLFYGSKSDIRKFFDQLVWCFYPEHAALLVGYEKLLAERLKLLSHGGASSVWLTSLEHQITEKALILYKNRLEFSRLLNEFINDNPLFLGDSAWKCILDTGDITDFTEDFYKKMLFEARHKDMLQKRSGFGVHKMNWTLWDQKKNCSAEICSTGEQKIMLISLILSSAALLQERVQKQPIILLDDICAHLDEYKRRHLFSILEQRQLQTFLTGTERFLFEGLKDAQFICLKEEAFAPSVLV